VLCLHRLRSVRFGFLEALSINSKVRISEPEDGEIIENRHIYLAPANYHLMLDPDGRFRLSVTEPVNHSRPSIDVCFETAAESFAQKVIGVILSGANQDGAEGLHKIKGAGGLTIVQDPNDCEIKTMSVSCIDRFQPDYILNAAKIINFITGIK